MTTELLNVKRHASKPEYRLQISSMNCSWDIQVNQMPVNNYFGTRGGVSTDYPLNMNILSSGRQQLKVKIYPPKGQQKMDEYATLKLVLVYYPNNKNYEGGQQVLNTFELDGAQVNGLPYFEHVYSFEAEVPYTVEGWSKGQNLESRNNIKELVAGKMAGIKKILSSKNDNAFLDLVLQREKERYEMFYATDSAIQAGIRENSPGSQFEGLSNIIFSDADSSELSFFADGRVVGVKQWFDPSFEYGITCSAKDAKGEKAEGAFQFLFYMPKGSNELKVVR